MPPISHTHPDRLLFAAGDVRIGSFRCAVVHPDFSTAGPIEGYTVAFPRTAVWIRHADRPAFVADPGIATVYNRGQPYTRAPLAADGDRSDWFSVSRALAQALMAELRPDTGSDGPDLFPVAFGRITTAVYYRQRLVFNRVQLGLLRDPLEVEQEVVLIVGTVLRLALPPQGRGRAPSHPVAQLDLVERTREVLARHPFAQPTVRQLAATVGSSPFHLCRVFRRHTGLTLHHYLLDLRTRLALEQVEQGASLSHLASRCGFSSHSHFTAEFRRRFGTVPSRARCALRPRPARLTA